MKFHFSTMPNNETSQFSRLALRQAKRILTAIEISKTDSISTKHN